MAVCDINVQDFIFVIGIFVPGAIVIYQTTSQWLSVFFTEKESSFSSQYKTHCCKFHSSFCLFQPNISLCHFSIFSSLIVPIIGSLASTYELLCLTKLVESFDIFKTVLLMFCPPLEVEWFVSTGGQCSPSTEPHAEDFAKLFPTDEINHPVTSKVQVV